jgi:hypothetical protein
MSNRVKLKLREIDLVGFLVRLRFRFARQEALVVPGQWRGNLKKGSMRRRISLGGSSDWLATRGG